MSQNSSMASDGKRPIIRGGRNRRCGAIKTHLFSLAIAVGITFGPGLPAVEPLSIGAAMALAEGENAPARVYRIAPGPLDAALAAFARQAGVKVAADQALTESKKTNGLSGEHTVSNGLERLLAGSGLQAAETAEKEFKVIRGQAPEAEERTAVLPTMTVKGGGVAGTRTIPADVLSRTQAQDMSDVFFTEPSISVGGGARNAQRIYLRGIEGSNLNITVDGAKQNTNMHQHRGGIGNIDPSLLKRVDVHPGPGADQGPGALGGSIRFETVDARDLLDPGKSLGATIRAGYGTADESWIGGATAYGQVGYLGLLAHGSLRESEDYRIGGGGDVPNSAADDRDYMAKVSLLDLAGHSLRMSAEHNASEGLYLWGSTGSDMGYAAEGSKPVTQRIERETYTFDHRFHPGNPLIDTRLNLYLADNSLENLDTDTEYESRQIGGDLRNTFQFDLGPTHHRMTVGTDYLAEQGTAPRGFGSDKGKSIENESTNLGLFLQDRMGIGPAGISFGARFDDFEAEYWASTCSGSEVSPNVGIDY